LAIQTLTKNSTYGGQIVKRKILGIMIAVSMVAAMTGCGGANNVSTQDEPVTSVKEDTTTAQVTEEAKEQETETQETEVQDTETEEPSTETPALTGPVEFTLVSVGGMYFDETIINEAKAAGGYDYLFEDVKPLIEGADVAIGVIQTPLKSMEGYDIASAISNAGFDVINVATTNVADNGEIDLNATLGQPHTNGMEVCGVTSQVNPYNKIAYVDVKGAKVAFIAGAEGAVSEEGRYDINTLDEDLIVSQIEEAKSEGAAVIVVSLNYVDNGQDSFEDDKRDFINRLGSAGANIVLCSGLDNVMITNCAMDYTKEIYGVFIPYQGSFVSSTTDIAALYRIKVKIEESGYVDVLNHSLEGEAIYIDSADHYKLVPVSKEDATNGDYPDDFKEFAVGNPDDYNIYVTPFYNFYNEIEE